jgi:NADPH2:quinone reductase
MGGSEGTLSIGFLLHQYLRIIGTVMKSRSLEEKISMTTRFKDRWLESFSKGSLRPVVDKVFPLEAAAEAHLYFEKPGRLGNVTLAMD